jgi:repressor LexA
VNQELSERQARILDYIREVTRVRSYPPSVREIGEAVGLSSSSTVHNHLNQLERRGLIKRDPSKSRTVQLVETVHGGELRRRAVAVPLVGNVAAGVPILAEQNIEDHLMLSPDIAQEGWFALRVRGDSMINAGILDGDLVLVRPQPDAPDGTIVVAMVEEEATVKRLDRSLGRVRLIAENPAYGPIEPDQAEMVGEVKGLIRSYGP